MSQLIKVSCMAPSLTQPEHKFEAEAEAVYRASLLENGRIDLELQRIDVWLDGNPSFVDLPGKYEVELDRKAMSEAQFAGVE